MNVFSQTQSYLRWQAKVACAPLMAAMLLSASVYAVPVKPVERNPASKTASRATITGTVKDDKGVPLPGVSVKIKGAAGGTSTDVNGLFKLNVSGDELTLVFSFLGFESKEIRVAAGQTVVNVALKESVAALQDVVVDIGYGQKKRSQVTGSVATITGAELQDIPAPNIASALRNRIAGVSVEANSGRPGSSITLNIRNSPMSNAVAGVKDEPLYVIDNIVVPKGTFDALDPSMVENVTFLKDASAAIYGAAGAKGVILVTTKRGKDGKISVSYNGYYGTTDMATRPEMLSAYDHASLINDGLKYSTSANAGSFFTDKELDSLKSVPTRSWLDELWEASVTQRHNLSISGGSEKVTFFVGGSYSNENGNYAGIKYDKYAFRSGLNTKISNSLKASIDFNLDNSVKFSQNPFSENDQNFYRGLISTPSWIPIEIDGMPVNFSNVAANNNRNPLAIIRSGYNQTSKSYGARINAQLHFSPQALKGFTAALQISPSISNSRSNTYTPPYKVYNFLPQGNNRAFFSNTLNPTSPFNEGVSVANSRLAPGLSSGNSYQATLRLQYMRTFGKHDVSVMIAPEQSEGYSEDLSTRWANQRIPGISELWAFDQTTFTLDGRSINESIKRSVPMRVAYSYGQKYLMEFTARFDASNNFAKGEVWGFFPSMGLGWVMSEENFFKDALPFVNYLKLKGNIGILGDDRVGTTLWQDRYSVDLNGYSFGENMLPGANPKEIANPTITWEKAKIWGTGIEASLFKNRLNLGVDFYHRINYDMFDKNANASFPAYFGQIAPVENYMRSRSWGTEFSIGYNDKLTHNLSFNSSVNFAFTNQVNERFHYEVGDLFFNTPPDFLLRLGTNTRIHNSNNYGLVSRGILKTQADVDALLDRYPNYTINGKVPEVGWIYFEDTDGDGIITEMDQVPMFKRVDPFLAMGISFGLKYKSFDFSTNINAQLGGKAFYDSYSSEEATVARNVGAYWKDHWTPENPNAKYPRFDDPGMAAGWQSTYWATNGTMIRVNTMTLGYRVPKNLVQRVGLSNLRVLVTGNNLWSIVNPIKNKDPYSQYLYDYPTLRTISIGVNLGL